MSTTSEDDGVPGRDPGVPRELSDEARPLVLDIHAGFGTSLRGHSITLDEELEAMDRLAVKGAVLAPQKPPGYHLEAANDAAYCAVEAHPERLRYWCRVDPWQGAEAIELLTEHLDQGAVGLFLHPHEELFPVSDPVVDPLVELCRQRKKPVLISGGHVRVSMAWQIAELAARFPDVDLIATSGGQINISGIELAGAEALLEDHANVWMETSGIYREDFIEDMAARFGAGRILFGSGAPPFDRDLELRRAEWAHLSAEDRAKILGANARRLLGLDRAGPG